MKKVNLDDNTLTCPSCNGPYLHQKIIGIYNCREGEKEGTHVEVDWDKIAIDKSMTGNPSPYRQGLSIAFYCEQCDPDDTPEKILNIYQHKGETVIEWETK